MEKSRKKLTKDQALSRLESLCSRSEQCAFDVDNKMRRWGLNTSERGEVLEKLYEDRFIDDMRYAKSFTNDKAKFSFWGPNKIKLELAKKRIKSLYIREAISQIDNEVWKSGLLKNAVAKARNLELNGDEGRENCQKIIRYLYGRGFPVSASVKVVGLIKNQQKEGK